MFTIDRSIGGLLNDYDIDLIINNNDLNTEMEDKNTFCNAINMIHFDLSSINNSADYKKELMRFEVSESESIKKFFLELDNLGFNYTYKNNALFCDAKYGTIIIKDIYYSYNTFKLNVSYGLKSNYIDLANKGKRYSTEYLFEILNDYKVITTLGRIINYFKNHNYYVSSKLKTTDIGPHFELNNGDIICLFDRHDMHFVGCKVRVCYSRKKFIRYIGNLSKFLCEVDNIYSSYINNMHNKNANEFINKCINKNGRFDSWDSESYESLIKKLDYIKSKLPYRFNSCIITEDVNTHNIILSLNDNRINIYILNIRNLKNKNPRKSKTFTAIIAITVDNKIHTLDGEIYKYSESEGYFISTNSNVILRDAEMLRTEIPSGYRCFLEAI